LYTLQAVKTSFSKIMDIMTPTNPPFVLSEDFIQQLPTRIGELRKTAGLTQASVAEQLNISKSRYNHYERGIRRFPLGLLPQLIEILGCSEAEFLGSEEPRKKRGPLSAWEKRVATIKSLPSDKQKEIQNVVDALISKAS
jgi:transcriptional regulator with XRE-family HTH domain